MDEPRDDSIKQKLVEKLSNLEENLPDLPTDIDAAYYLIHSMSSNRDNFDELEILVKEKHIGVIKMEEVSEYIILQSDVETIIKLLKS